MPSIHETAYPRLKASVTARDLAEIYTPAPEEVTLATSLTRSETARACFVLLCKTFQRLGYFVYVQEVPEPIVTHITPHLGIPLPAAQRQAYDISGTRRRHVTVIRDYLHVLPYGPEAQTVLEQTIRDAAPTKEELADLPTTMRTADAGRGQPGTLSSGGRRVGGSRSSAARSAPHH